MHLTGFKPTRVNALNRVPVASTVVVHIVCTEACTHVCILDELLVEGTVSPQKGGRGSCTWLGKLCATLWRK
jgi:hypothetical protein